jgi:hypothetical protein
MSFLNERQNILDSDHGVLTSVGQEGTQTTYIRSDAVGDGLLYNGGVLTGSAYINCFSLTSSNTTIGTQSVFTKVIVDTTEGFSRDGFVHTDNRITNTGRSKVVQANAILSLQAGNGNEVHLAFFKNDTIVPCSEQDQRVTSQKSSPVPIQCLVELDTNDYIEVWTKNASSTTSVSVDHYNLIVREL